MTILIGIDDTDTLETRGTGRLARQIADLLSVEYNVLGVVRHQLLVDPRVAYTKNNSCATILLEAVHPADLDAIFRRVRDWMLADNPPGSDPGLCVTDHVPGPITEFGRKTKVELVTKVEALNLAREHEIRLVELGGNGDGVIGALAGVGLAASNEDGRYVQVGELRALSGLQPVENVLTAGVDRLLTTDNQPVTDGWVMTDKLRPARRGGRAVAYVFWDTDHWQPVKLD
jgi:tRNA(Ile2) C34 agmatinyltransferase TiaS